MKTIQIEARKREVTGKKDSKKLRSEGNVPCVMYGGEEILHFYAHENSFRHIIYTPDAYVINLDIEGKKVNGILKEIQFHPVSDKVTHIDFVQVFDDRPIIMNIPVKAIGESPGLMAGGKLRLKRRTLSVKGLIKDMPEKLEIDISELAIGQSIKVHQLSYENIEILDPLRAMVVAVISSRMAIKEEELEEEEEELEGEEGAEEGAGEGTGEGTGEEKAPDAGSDAKEGKEAAK